MELSGTVRDGVIVLDEGSLPEGTKVTVASDVSSPPTHLEILKDFVGKAKGLPEDFAENHDFYIRGGAKK
jgi:hypothetical protein